MLQAPWPSAVRVGEGTGLSSRLWRIGDQLVKHANQPEDAVREAAFYTRWAPQTGLPLPRLHAHSGDWLVLDWLDGEAGDCLVGASGDRAAAVAEALGRIACVAVGDAPPPGLRTVVPAGKALEQRITKIENGVRHLHRHFPAFAPLAAGLPAAYVRAAERLSRRPGALCHADFHVENLLFPNAGAAGSPGPGVIVLDWQTVGWAPPAIDVTRFAFEGLADPTTWRAWAPHAVEGVPDAAILSLGGFIGSRWLAQEVLTERQRALLHRSLEHLAIVLGSGP